MRPLFQRTFLLARQFTLQEFVSSNRTTNQPHRQQLYRPVCLRCQFVVLRSRPFSIGHGSSPPPGQPPLDEKEKDSPTTGDKTPDGSPVPPLLIDRSKLPSEQENKRLNVSKKMSTAMNDLQGALFVAGKRLNEVTGYSGIEQMKKVVGEQETYVRETRAEVRAAKEAYQAAINRRSASQREVNELLQRKHAWSPSDLERFASLYRSDHANEQAETAAQERLTKAERVADEAQSLLTKSILSRYHEEQIWSDKIRSASTWVTWALMGFNVFLFVIVQLGLEPWRRRRLVGSFEEKVREVVQEETLRSVLLKLDHPQAAQPQLSEEPMKLEVAKAVEGEAELSATHAAVEESTEEQVEEPVEEDEAIVADFDDLTPVELKSWKETAQLQVGFYKEKISDLFVVTLRRIDLTSAAAGAVAGAAAGAMVTVLYLRR